MIKNKPTIGRLLLAIVYLFICCLIFFSLALIAIKFIIHHEVVIERADIKQVAVVSAIAATAAAFRSWLFALLDERKMRKKPPE
ncbi:hypothetical protein NGC23_16605 [Leclercia pneumoniae]|uniref:hypothetical protein n=1 Tax=Leclercia pneumoniae TaxID=2815358 RepID=UPI002DB769DB|nr:hypothetical protein [Leclercia pneumoniae]MEB7501800.1 hypothetical protein [Leclercia pneumoniae]